MDAGAGADIDDVIGGEDRVLVMLDDDDGVAEVAQAAQRAEQPLIVALVQADRGLVEHIEHAGEAGADLAGEPDALALAARERARGAGERQVFQPDIEQEGQPVADLLEDARGDLVLLLAEARGQAGDPVERVLDREPRDLADMAAVDLDRERLGLEAEALAGLARRLGHEAADLLAGPVRLRLLPAPLHIGDDALEGLPHLIGAQAVIIGHADRLGAGAVEDRDLGAVGKLGPGLGHREAEMAGERLQRLAVIGRGRLGPGGDGALLQAERGIRDDHVRVDAHLVAETVAGRAGAEGVVEGEQARLDLGDREAGDRAGEFRGEDDAARRAVLLLLVGIFEDGDAVGEVERLLQRVGEARAEIGPDHKAIDDDVDVVLELLVERGRIGDLDELAIDLDALEAALEPLRHLLAELALAAAHDGASR